MDPRTMRHHFIRGLLAGMRVLWPIFSALLAAMAGLGVAVGMLEGWSLQESLYFAFVSGLTIGYGDLAAKTLLGRTLSILIGVCGVLFTALLAAVAVRALPAAENKARDHQ